MGRRIDRADDLAGRVLALHARHRLVVHLGIVALAFVVAIDSEPVHLAPAPHFVLADDGNVVFGHAGDDAGVAADAGVEIDGHPPGIAFVFEPRIEASCVRMLIFGLNKLRIAAELFEGAGADKITSLHHLVKLCAGNRILIGELAQSCAR